MCSTVYNFSCGQRLRYASETGAKSSGAVESGSAPQGSGQEISDEKKAHTWGYDDADADTEEATDVDEAPFKFMV